MHSPVLREVQEKSVNTVTSQKNRIWTVLKEVGSHPYWPTFMQAQMTGDAMISANSS